MKMTKTFISIIIFLTLFSCNNSQTQDKSKQETPKALADNVLENEIYTKRDYNDLVESLYNELVSKNAELKNLEDRIDELNRSKSDSTNLFDKFNGKNQSYFNSADKHISEIKDTLLRNKMNSLIVGNLAIYNLSIARHKELLKIMETNNVTISDLHNVLKIVKTFPLIEKFQKDNLPGTNPFENYIKLQDKTIKLTDTVIKK